MSLWEFGLFAILLLTTLVVLLTTRTKEHEQRKLDREARNRSAWTDEC